MENILTQRRPILKQKNVEKKKTESSPIATREHRNSRHIFYDDQGCKDVSHDLLRKSFFTALKKTGIIGFRFYQERNVLAT